MAQLVDWPSTPFYIRAAAPTTPNLLAMQSAPTPVPPPATPDPSPNLTMQTFGPTAEQLWVARSNGAGASVLINLATGNALQYQVLFVNNNFPLLGVQVTSVPLNPASTTQGWVLSDVGSGNFLILPELDQSYCLLGSPTMGSTASLLPFGAAIMDDLTDPESLQFNIVKEEGTFTIQNLDYPTDSITKPTVYSGDALIAPLVINNISGKVASVGTEQIAYTSYTSSTFKLTTTNAETTRITASLGLGIVGEILSLNTKGEVTKETTNTVTMENGQTQSTTEQKTYTVNFNVPAGCKYMFQLSTGPMSFSANFSANAVLESSIPGAVPISLPISGGYAGLATTTVSLTTTDLTNVTSDVTAQPKERVVVAVVPINDPASQA